MRSSGDFTAVLRRGRRAGRRSITLHYLGPGGAGRPGQPPGQHSAGLPVGAESRSPAVGFVVPKTVGPAVMRNRVQRRLRHLMRERLAGLPDGCALVIRVHPVAARTLDLAADLDDALAAVRPSGAAP